MPVPVCSAPVPVCRPPIRREGREISAPTSLTVTAAVLILLTFACGRPGAATDATAAATNSGASPTPEGNGAIDTRTSTPGDVATPTGPQPTAIDGAQATATFGPQPATPAPSATPLPTPSSRGGTLRTAIPNGPAHFDVHQDASPALAQWGPGIVYSRLLRFRTDPRAQAPNGEEECDLCESWQMVSATEYQVRLRANATWQDLAPLSGRLVTAHDIVFSLRRQSTPGWPNAPVLSPLKDVTAVDDRTVRLVLSRPDAEFLGRLADGHSRIVAPEAVAVSGDLLGGPVIGSGPWQLLDASETGLKYIANPDYYEADLPYVDFLNVAILASDEVRATALRTRTLDVASVGAIELADALGRFPELRWAKTLEPGAGAEVALKVRPPFDTITARQAVFLALNPWRDVDQLWHGGATPTSGLPVQDASWIPSREVLQDFLAQPGRAAMLAAESGVAGSPIEISVGEFGAVFVEQAQEIAEDLVRAGFQPSLQRVSTRRFGDEVWFGGRYQMFVGAQPPTTSLAEYLFAVHHSRGTWNTAGFASTKLDSLIEAQAVEFDRAKRRELVLEIQREILGGAYRFSPATLYTHWAWWPGVQGFVPNTYRGESFFLARTWLTSQ